ncbi:hypothetical protein F2Q70_00020262 [Brassica cretica]|uniref:Zinc finger GRF-type domain-containing protein n=1 Tax=Brassica cretica TaxID=69181 RepID=A0A8S9MLA8_BRACR|nr:hypothetical protein F2Q70_00020262 [Brassica cretica]KAF2619812.1 hypothetical protein F2Q68_00040745 [Brassica cretica]
MGQDYSYSQRSSSEEYDIDLTSLLQAEADMYADEVESSYNIAEPVQYPPQPEADDGIPKTCYCGGEPVIATSYTRKDPGRRYFTCENVDDGDCQVKDQGNESAQKLVKLEKTVWELAKKKSGVTNGFELVVCVMSAWNSFRGLKCECLTFRRFGTRTMSFSLTGAFGEVKVFCGVGHVNQVTGSSVSLDFYKLL